MYVTLRWEILILDSNLIFNLKMVSRMFLSLCKVGNDFDKVWGSSGKSHICSFKLGSLMWFFWYSAAPAKASKMSCF